MPGHTLGTPSQLQHQRSFSTWPTALGNSDICTGMRMDMLEQAQAEPQGFTGSEEHFLGGEHTFMLALLRMCLYNQTQAALGGLPWQGKATAPQDLHWLGFATALKGLHLWEGSL